VRRLLEVHARGEGSFALAGQHDGADGRICVAFIEPAHELSQQGRGQRVESLRPVQREDGDVAVALVQQRLRHR
jgi:hypothetical protein